MYSVLLDPNVFLYNIKLKQKSMCEIVRLYYEKVNFILI